MRAEELSLEWLENDPRALTEPIFVADPEGLEMSVLPKDIRISEIAKAVGEDKSVDVIGKFWKSPGLRWRIGHG